MNRKWLILIVALVALLVLIGSRISMHRGYFAEDKSETARLIDQFHARLNANQFDQIYDDADDSLKQSDTRENWRKVLVAVLDHTGQFRRVNNSKLNVIVGAQVEIRGAYRSTFEKGTFTELFAFVRRGEQVRLAYYSAFNGTDNDVKQQ